MIIICNANLQMWPSLIAKAKAGGLDVIETLVFWNLHEPQPGQVALIIIMFISAIPLMLNKKEGKKIYRC